MRGGPCQRDASHPQPLSRHAWGEGRLPVTVVSPLSQLRLGEGVGVRACEGLGVRASRPKPQH